MNTAKDEYNQKKARLGELKLKSIDLYNESVAVNSEIAALNKWLDVHNNEPFQATLSQYFASIK